MRSVIAIALGAAAVIAAPLSPATAGDAPAASARTAVVGEELLPRVADLPIALGPVKRVDTRRWAGQSTQAAVCGAGPDDILVPVDAQGGVTWLALDRAEGWANIGARVRVFPDAASAKRAWARITATAVAECTGPLSIAWEDDADVRIGDIRGTGSVRAGASTMAITSTSSFIRASTGAAERTGTAIGVWRRSGRVITEVLANRSIPAQRDSAWTPAERAAIVAYADRVIERATRGARDAG